MKQKENKLGQDIYRRLMKRFKRTTLALKQVKECLIHIGGDGDHCYDRRHLTLLRKKRRYLPHKLDTLVDFRLYNLSAKVSDLDMLEIVQVMCLTNCEVKAVGCLVRLNRLYSRFVIDFNVEASSTRLLAQRVRRRYGGGWLTRKEEAALFSYITARAAHAGVGLFDFEQLRSYSFNNHLYEYAIASSSLIEKVEDLLHSQKSASALGMKFGRTKRS
jgi:hypothetical protein